MLTPSKTPKRKPQSPANPISESFFQQAVLNYLGLTWEQANMPLSKWDEELPTAHKKLWIAAENTQRSPGTIRRWALGNGCPADYTRKKILDLIEKS